MIFYGQKNDNAKTVIDTITGYPRNVSPEIKSATVISEDAEITGDLKRRRAISILLGVINGNIDMQGSMKASGTINGNVMASEATITRRQDLRRVSESIRQHHGRRSVGS